MELEPLGAGEVVAQTILQPASGALGRLGARAARGDVEEDDDAARPEEGGAVRRWHQARSAELRVWLTLRQIGLVGGPRLPTVPTCNMTA